MNLASYLRKVRDMLHAYEFEVFKDEDGDMYLALPYNLDGGTQGKSFAEACENAADWLSLTMEHHDMHGIEFPKATFGNKPRESNGQTIIVAVKAGKETVPRMTGAEAARRLGVTRGRVSQMVKAGLLETFELNGRNWISEHSVNARLEERPKAGRPAKDIASSLQTAKTAVC